MSTSELHLKGAQADYIAQYSFDTAGPVPVLVGVSHFTRGEVHLLQGIQIIAFADGRLDLTLTTLAQSLSEGRTVSTTGSSPRGYDLLSWVSDVASDQEGLSTQAGISIGIRGVSIPKPEALTAFPDLEDELPETPSSQVDSMRGKSPAQEAMALQLDSPKQRTAPEEVSTSTKTASGLVSAQVDFVGFASGSLGNGFPPVVSTPSVTELIGTTGPDFLKGGSGPDIINGVLNTESDAGQFFEQLLGMAGDDRLIYSGFFGDADGLSSISAQLDGDVGNDVLEVTLDSISTVKVSGGAGSDVLVIQTGLGQSSPWDPDWMAWRWAFDQGSYQLKGSYTQPARDDAGVTETSPDLEWISSGASSPMRLVRPDADRSSLMEGSTGRDWLLATDATQRIDAKAGDDLVLAKAGVVVSLGAGVNTVYADSANFTLSYSDSPYSVRLNLANNMGLVFDEDAGLYAIDRLLTAPLEVQGSVHKDVITGDAANNTFRTGGGSDVLTGGAGADLFILDSHPLDDTVRVTDLDVLAGDHLTLNLSAWDGLVNASFSSFELLDVQGEHLWSGDVASSPEAGSLLSLMLSADHKTLYWAEDVDTSHALLLSDSPLDGLSADQWAAVLSVDYL